MIIIDMLAGRQNKDTENAAMLHETYQEMDKLWQEVGGSRRRNSYSYEYEIAGQQVLVFFAKEGSSYSLEIKTPSYSALPSTFLLDQSVHNLTYYISPNPEHTVVCGATVKNNRFIKLNSQNDQDAFLQEMQSFQKSSLPVLRQLFLQK